MIRSMVIFAFLWLTVSTATAQEIKVDPTGVNVNSQGGTTRAVTKSDLATQDEFEPFKRLRTILSSRIRQVLAAFSHCQTDD